MVHSASSAVKSLGLHVFRYSRRNLSVTPAVNKRISVLGIGTPLLDFTVFDDHGLMKRYGIEKNAVTEVGPAHRHIFDEIQQPPHQPVITLGGSTQNTIRIAEWALGRDGRTAFYGSIANDNLGMLMRKLGEESAVETLYRVREGVRTGALLSFNFPHHASMIIDYGTAGSFNTDVLHDPELHPMMLEADLVYVGAYLWSTSPVTGMTISRFTREQGTPLAMDLQSNHFCEYFASTQFDVLKYVDYLFGNASEALMLAKCLANSSFPFASEFKRFKKEGHPTTENLLEIAKSISAIPKAGELQHRCVVFTHGSHPAVYCSTKDNVSGSVPASPMEPKRIKDPRGRGDAFVGGFLAVVAQGGDVLSACKAGMKASNAVLQSVACNPKERHKDKH